MWSVIRSLLASTREARLAGYDKGQFSFNRSGGRCEACHGLGHRILEIPPLPQQLLLCEVCEGRRFDQATLRIAFRGKNIHQILAMEIAEARQLFSHQPKLSFRLQALVDAGIGYIKMGQPTTSLSGGERRRMRLATELARKIRLRGQWKGMKIRRKTK